MKKNLLATVLDSMLFSVAVFSTMIVMPALLGAHAGNPVAANRYLDAPYPGPAQRGHVRTPGTDGEGDAPAVRKVPVEAALPDAAIIALPEAKKRSKTIKA